MYNIKYRLPQKKVKSSVIVCSDLDSGTQILNRSQMQETIMISIAIVSSR